MPTTTIANLRPPAGGTAAPPALAALAGRGPAHQRLLYEVARYAQMRVDVLLLGPTGTGKSTIARLLHELSGLPPDKLVDINCAETPESLIEVELFGSERGAFTGALSRPGLFEQADGGTLFLDEIGELSQPLQAKLLKAVERKRIRRVGGQREIPCRTRLIYATHRRLEDPAVFREDFRYRIDQAVIHVPTLRDRFEALPELVRFMFQWAQEELQRATPYHLAPDAVSRFYDYDWPGNIRELRNAVLKLALAAFESGSIDAEMVRVYLADLRGSNKITMAREIAGTDEGVTFTAAFVPDYIARQRAGESFDLYMDRVLAETYYHLVENRQLSVSAACRLMGVQRSSFYRRLEGARARLAGAGCQYLGAGQV